MHVGHPPQCTIAYQLTRLGPLRMEPHHESLGQMHFLRERQQHLELRRPHPHGLFAQYVLARLGGPTRPLHVHVVGERVVDDVDGRVSQEFLVGPVGRRDVVAFRKRLTAAEVA